VTKAERQLVKNASCKIYPHLIFNVQNEGPSDRGALGLCPLVLTVQ